MTKIAKRLYAIANDEWKNMLGLPCLVAKCAKIARKDAKSSFQTTPDLLLYQPKFMSLLDRMNMRS
jgi:hypothetical protein